jgi:hypothetical protein
VIAAVRLAASLDMGGHAQGERFALVLLCSIGRDRASFDAACVRTRELVDAALAVGGAHYLPYQCWPTRDQLRRAYPRFDAFVAEKNRIDPDGRFTNTFFMHYARH